MKQFIVLLRDTAHEVIFLKIELSIDFSLFFIAINFTAKRLREENNYQNVELVKQTSTDGQAGSSVTEGDLEELLQDYKSFHDTWVEKCKRLHGKPYGC